MHELSLLAEMLPMVLQEARRHGARSIDAIRLQVGAMSGVEPEALRLAFPAVVKDTPAEQARLLLEETPVVARCPLCRHEFTPDDIVYVCPRCESPASEIVQGQELTLLSIEVSIDE